VTYLRVGRDDADLDTRILEIAARPDEHGDSGAVDVDHVRQVKQHDKRPACDDAVDVPMQGNGVWELERPADANDR